MEGPMDKETSDLINQITAKGKQKATDLVELLTLQEGQKKDFVAPTDTMNMKMINKADEAGTGFQELELKFIEIHKDGIQRQHSMPLTDWGHRQIAEKTDIPKRYYDRMRDTGNLGLVAANVNTWINDREHRFIRTLNGSVRAILSDRYLVLDNLMAIKSAATKASELGATMADCEISDTRMYVKMIDPHETWEIKQNDHHVRGVIFSNSEVGAGSFRAEAFVMRLVCSNGMIGMDKLAKVHLGSKMAPGMYISDRTRELEAETIASKCQDIVESVFDREKFDAWMEHYRATTDVQLKSPMDATKNVIRNFKLNENLEKDLMNALIREGDSTQYGLINALTAHAQQIKRPEIKIEIEKVAGQISVMPEKEFEKAINSEIAVVA